MFGKKSFSFENFLQQAAHQRTFLFSLLIVGALLAFEIFNYSTTEFAMSDLLGNLKFGGVTWATILALAFCGIDFAGIARLFTPEQGDQEPSEIWYLFGAWLIAATMNAILTWWGVSIAILQHQSLGNAVISRDMLLLVVPIFVALMVWLSRILIIGTFSVAGEKLFWRDTAPLTTQTKRKSTPNTNYRPQTSRPRPATSNYRRSTPSKRPNNQPAYSSFKPSPKPNMEERYTQAPMMAKSEDGSDNRGYY
ncbi:hypothetical protein KQH54_02600 [bacterium]|nr:hypothetical protein [bacterium]